MFSILKTSYKLKMRIIHIATFKGNIGDRINHEGFYRILRSVYNYIDITQIELRDFYFSASNKRNFDRELACKINTFDLCVFGGGGFFDAQWINSNTGVTLNLTTDFIDAIQIPVLVNAMGYHEYPGVTNEKICQKFNEFIKKILNKKNWYCTVRNDGSYERLINRYRCDFNVIEAKILKVPDNGFFCEFNDKYLIKKDKITIGMCITNDLFSEEYNLGVTTNEFNHMIARFIEEQAFSGKNVILFPHTPNDINVIGQLFAYISNEVKRNNILVAPYDASSTSSVSQLGRYYNRCDCVIGMRFHSIITAINLRIPTVALAGHRQIEALYEDLKLTKYCLKVDNLDIFQKLCELVEKCLVEKNMIIYYYDEIYSYYLKDLSIKYEELLKKI